jgi:hypothetical protein
MSGQFSSLEEWYHVIDNLESEEDYPKHSRTLRAKSWTVKQSSAKVVDMSGNQTSARVRVTFNWHLTGPNGIEQYHTADSGKAWLEDFVDVAFGIVDRYSVMLRQGITNEYGEVGRTHIELAFHMTGWLGEFTINVISGSPRDFQPEYLIHVVSDGVVSEHPMWLVKLAKDLTAWRHGIADSVKVGWDSNSFIFNVQDTPLVLLVKVSKEYTDVLFSPHGEPGTDFRAKHHTLLRMLTSTRESLLYFGYGLVALPDESWKL